MPRTRSSVTHACNRTKLEEFNAWKHVRSTVVLCHWLICTVPRILAVHLKRFDPFTRSKLTNNVNIPFKFSFDKRYLNADLADQETHGYQQTTSHMQHPPPLIPPQIFGQSWVSNWLIYMPIPWKFLDFIKIISSAGVHRKITAMGTGKSFSFKDGCYPNGKWQ